MVKDTVDFDLIFKNGLHNNNCKFMYKYHADHIQGELFYGDKRGINFCRLVMNHKYQEDNVTPDAVKTRLLTLSV